MAPYGQVVAGVAVDAIKRVVGTCSLDDIRIISRPGGTLDDIKILEGLALKQGSNRKALGPTRIEKARIALCQFCLSAPKTDLDNQVVITDYAQMDRILKEERLYIAALCKKIKKAGANVLLIQKSILRDAVSELALHYLAKMKIMVVDGVERDEIEFLARGLGCRPIADIEGMTEEKLGTAEFVEDLDEHKLVLISGVKTPPAKPTVSILCRGASKEVAEEAERSLHDALCVLRCLHRRPALIAGGGVPELALSIALDRRSKELTGSKALCFSAFAEALLAIPTVLAENAGMDPLSTVTKLRALHAQGKNTQGVNVRRGEPGDMKEEGVLQPLLVSLSALQLATESVCMILKIDDIIEGH